MGIISLGGALLSLSAAVGSIAQLKPLAKLAEPIMKAVPETGGGKKVPSRLSGGLLLANLSFRYTEDGPWILEHCNLKIRPGQYIGVVLQNSKLFTGDIYSNITISAPGLTLQGAWKAARMAGMDEDIRRMPMRMQTLISEGGGGISGGQRLRLMIARAIASKPRILMFDEATSALDNITQRTFSDSLAALRCTRIVIAHRLSTICQCDRILVLDGGKIVEDGAYDELLRSGGFFAELVKRQTLDSAEAMCQPQP